MTDYVLQSPSRDAFVAAATQLGYVDADGNLVVTGTTSDGGNYFINEVGAVDGQTGHWSRIRVNNDQPIPAVPQGFTLYPPVQYLPDGVTPDPSYSQPNIGCIA